MGAKLGHMWRGKWAILPGMVAYGGIATFSQFAVNLMHSYRLSKGLQLEQMPVAVQDPVSREPTILELMKDPFVRNDDMTVDPPSDPVRSLLKWGVQSLERTFGKLPDRASPLANAFDIEYRDRLNWRLSKLTAQVTELEDQVKAKAPESRSTTS